MPDARIGSMDLGQTRFCDTIMVGVDLKPEGPAVVVAVLDATQQTWMVVPLSPDQAEDMARSLCSKAKGVRESWQEDDTSTERGV